VKSISTGNFLNEVQKAYSGNDFGHSSYWERTCVDMGDESACAFANKA